MNKAELNMNVLNKVIAFNIKIKGHISSFYIGVWKNIFPKQAYKT